MAEEATAAEDEHGGVRSRRLFLYMFGEDDPDSGFFSGFKLKQERLERIGPIAYYSEWVKAWKRDTSHEAVQKHFEETGEDENISYSIICHDKLN